MKLVTIVLAATATVAHAANIQPLILGGTVVPTGTKTYQVGMRLTEGSSNICGGSLISPTKVLTAAHCQWTYANFISIGSHSVNGTTDGERIRIKSMTPHPQFDGDLKYYDYNIVELASPSKFPPVKLLSTDPETFAGATATVMGWGLTKENGRAQPYELQRLDVPVLSKAQCKAAGLTSAPIDDTMVCAGGLTNRDACGGDSGGPLFLEQPSGDAVFGVVSWGEGCGRAGKPGVYARISMVKNWIQSLAPDAVWVGLDQA